MDELLDAYQRETGFRPWARPLRINLRDAPDSGRGPGEPRTGQYSRHLDLVNDSGEYCCTLFEGYDGLVHATDSNPQGWKLREFRQRGNAEDDDILIEPRVSTFARLFRGLGAFTGRARSRRPSRSFSNWYAETHITRAQVNRLLAVYLPRGYADRQREQMHVVQAPVTEEETLETKAA